MSKIFQIVNNKCRWQTPFASLAETSALYPPDIEFVETPDWVYEVDYMEGEEEWGFDRTKEGDERFIHPEPKEGFIWDDEDHAMYAIEDLPRILDEEKLKKQEENKMLFANWLNNHPITWKDGKQYGVTMEDQSEIQLNMSQYQIKIAAGIKDPVLQWHSIHEACVDWSVEALTALILDITNYIYPLFELMNQYKANIFACEDHHEVRNMDLYYPDDVEDLKNQPAED